MCQPHCLTLSLVEDLCVHLPGSATSCRIGTGFTDRPDCGAHLSRDADRVTIAAFYRTADTATVVTPTSSSRSVRNSFKVYYPKVRGLYLWTGWNLNPGKSLDAVTSTLWLRTMK
ncbi:hypothetical protein QAD02_024393 [Eretmocerus hayati]|uniref:Uncharacterized protein n=1 Tax=Eretmocerus hayati TaxID=131215 RepID=A0ACC2PYM1_9HYME|nr:hypothetical protein QAD02_024393 [Eretmocerus hayati]